MSISYNYFLPTNIYGTLRVTDLGFPGYTAVNANIYCQRNINSDGQMQCGSFKSLGASVFDQVPTCITNATTATELTNYQTVQGLITASGGITLQQAIDGVHASSQQFTVPQNIWNTLTFRAVGGSPSTTLLQHSDTIGYFIFTNTSSTGHYRFNVNTAGVQSSVLEMDSTLFIVRAGTVQLNLTTVNALTCSNNATFNGAYPTTTLGTNSGNNNNEFATVGYAKSIGGTSILGLNNTFTGTNTFNIPIISSGASLGTNTIPALSIVNNSLTNTQIATGFQLVSTNSQTYAGVKTFSSAIVSSGASLTANTIPALSIVNNSLTDTQIATGFQLVSTNSQTYAGVKTFSSAIVSSGASLTANTIPSASLVNNSITSTQIATGFQLVSTSGQTFSGNKIFNGTGTINEMIINIPSTFVNYNGSVGFIPACVSNYLNLTTEQFDSMMYIGQPIANGINKPYGFSICDYNSGGTGIRISGTGVSGNCGISLNGTVLTTQLLTCDNGLFVNLGDISTPNNAILGNIFSDIINNYNQITGTDITLNPNNFVQMLVNAGNNSVLPSSVISYGGLKIGWNCSNLTGETDFINLANYTNAGGFNFYTMNASILPSLIGSLSPTALTITGNLTNNQIINSSSTLPYHIKSGTKALPTNTTGDPRDGFLIGWNGLNGSSGETDFTNLNQGGNQGGFLFGNMPVGGSYQKLVQISPSYSTGLRIYPQCGKLQLDDSNAGAFNTTIIQTNGQSFYNTSGINTQIILQCGNATGVITNTMAMTTTTVQPFVNFSPASTTTFNASHPTTTLPLPTLSNQYATVGYVSSIVSPNLLPLNNTWTGTNLFNNTLTTNGTTNLNSVTLNSTTTISNTTFSGVAVFLNGIQAGGNIKLPTGFVFTATGITTFITIPPIIMFTPIAGMSFVLPNPALVDNVGFELIIRRVAIGSNTAVVFTATGAGLVFVPLNSGTAVASLSVLATWQIRLLSANNLYYQIA